MGGRTGACVLQWSWELRRWVQVAAAHRCTAGRAAARRNLERSMGGETTETGATRRRQTDGKLRSIPPLLHALIIM